MPKAIAFIPHARRLKAHKIEYLKAISEVLKSNHEYAIICEDDADLFWIRTWDRTIKNIVGDDLLKFWSILFT